MFASSGTLLNADELSDGGVSALTVMLVKFVAAENALASMDEIVLGRSIDDKAVHL